MRPMLLAAILAVSCLASTPALSDQIVSHPAGCPRIAFCGCGVAKYLLDKLVTRGGLARAAAWLSFPRAPCAPGMAAANRRHVFAIIRCLDGGAVLAYDPNSGRHKTRIHTRSLRGFVIVNPHGSFASRAARHRHGSRQRQMAMTAPGIGRIE